MFGMNDRVSALRTSTLPGLTPRLYQTGVPRVSSAIAYAPLLTRYQPGVGERASPYAVTVMAGKSCGRQRIQYWPATDASWSSTRVSDVVWVSVLESVIVSATAFAPLAHCT